MEKEQSFWVIKKNKPQFVTGVLKVEEEGEWCAGDTRFHEPDGHYYVTWFETPIDAIKDEINQAEWDIHFEAELGNDSCVEEAKTRKLYWINLLKEYEDKNA